MDELVGDGVERDDADAAATWDTAKALDGIFAGYIETCKEGGPELRKGIYFALEAIWTIHRGTHVAMERNQLEKVDADWGLNPRAHVPVPWAWVTSLAEAWGKVKEGEDPAKAFGFSGQTGQRGLAAKPEQVLNDVALATWMHRETLCSPAEGNRVTREELFERAATKWNLSKKKAEQVWDRHKDRFTKAR